MCQDPDRVCRNHGIFAPEIAIGVLEHSLREGNNMSIKRLHIGPRLSQVAIHGDTVYTAGIVADDTNVDVAGQTGQILDKIDQYLKEAGTDKTKIVSTTIWLADIKDFATMNSVWDQWVPKGNTPPRACVESKLATQAYKVEIRVIAAK
jgi:enamine deaminase RidA (YjgF/YER057c/UK114 family)